MEVPQPLQENIIENYVQIAKEKFYFHPNLTREDIFLIAARIFACHIKPLKSGTMTVLPNMMSVYSAPPDFVHKGEHMNLIDDIVNRVYESKLPQVPYVSNGKTDWININHVSFDLHGTPTGIVDEISGTRPGANEREHSPYDVVHFRDDEATDVFDGVDGKYHGMFQILNKLRDRVSGNIPLAKGMRFLPETKGFTMVAAVHSGEVSKAILSSGNLRRINLISVPYSEIIDDSQGLRNEVRYYFDEWKRHLFTHLDRLNQSLYNKEITFTWERDVEDTLVSIRKKAFNEVIKQGKRYTYDPEERVYFLLLYGMYSSLLNRHINSVDGEFKIKLSDLMYAQYHLNQLKEGYKQEIREFLPDDTQSIYEAVLELITEEWESTRKGTTKTMIDKSPKVPITKKVLNRSGKTKTNILNSVIAEALRNEEIKGVQVKPTKPTKPTIIYFPFDVSDEEIKSMYPDFQLIYS